MKNTFITSIAAILMIIACVCLYLIGNKDLTYQSEHKDIVLEDYSDENTNSNSTVTDVLPNDMLQNGATSTDSPSEAMTTEALTTETSTTEALTTETSTTEPSTTETQPSSQIKHEHITDYNTDYIEPAQPVELTPTVIEINRH